MDDQMNYKQQWKVNFLLLSMLFLNACASPKYLPKQKVEANYKTGISYTYQTLSQAYKTRGFKLDDTKWILIESVNHSPLSIVELQSLLKDKKLSTIELVLALPNNADFSNLTKQKKLWSTGSYLTENGKKQKIKFEEYKAKECNPCIDTKDEHQDKKKLIIESRKIVINT
jgi:hypothetical protein